MNIKEKSKKSIRDVFSIEKYFCIYNFTLKTEMFLSKKKRKKICTE